MKCRVCTGQAWALTLVTFQSLHDPHDMELQLQRHEEVQCQGPRQQEVEGAWLWAGQSLPGPQTHSPPCFVSWGPQGSHWLVSTRLRSSGQVIPDSWGAVKWLRHTGSGQPLVINCYFLSSVPLSPGGQRLPAAVDLVALVVPVVLSTCPPFVNSLPMTP